MATGPTVGVLSTSFGGSYFGALMGAITSTVADADGRLIAIQTLDAGTFAVDVADAPAFSHQVAWDHIAGFVVILNAVNSDYLRAIKASGRPTVIISNTPDGFRCPLILPDNHSGMRQATEHLITRHGHRWIGFAGYLGQQDARERYEAYRETLAAHGLEFRDEWFFDSGDMQEIGGEKAGRDLLDAGMPVTAMLTGNDQNAIGLMRVLTQAGVDLPGDLAVVGFDDTEEGANLTPNLTSVRQPLEQIGGLGARLLLRMVAGDDVEDGVHQVDTTLTVRESCGCARALAESGAPRAVHRVDAGALEAELLSGIRGVLAERRPDVNQDKLGDDLERGARAMSQALQGAVAGRTADTLELRQVLTPLTQALAGFQGVVDVMVHVRHLARTLQAHSRRDGDEQVAVRIEDHLNLIFFVLGQVHSAQQAHHAKSMMLDLATQYMISMELLRSQERDPRSLEWLRLTEVRAGCLGLWRAREPGEWLDVVQTFARSDPSGGPTHPDPTHPDPAHPDPAGARPDGGPAPEHRGDLALTSFPPADVVARADIHGDEMVYVAHLKVGSGDWGMLALVGPVQATIQQGRENMNQWSALLSVALEHEAILNTMREQEETLRRAALYDELTGLPNRSFFRDRLTLAMARIVRRPSYRYAVLMLDLDGFKLVNDSLGHLAGDRLLQQVASRLQSCLRAIDTASRFGGDEFAVLLEEIRDPDAAVSMAERLQQALSTPYDLHGHEVVVTASIGIALGSTDYEETEDILRDADAAMYHAKSRGKRDHAIFDPTMHASAVHRLRLEGELRRAVDQGELELHYQPIVDLGTGLVGGAEALIRWRHPGRGLVGPGEFLPVAEESGLIISIGNWVLDEACAQLARWRVTERETPFMMSVNVSNRQFWRGSLMEDVDQRLGAWGLDPRYLAIEITEGVIMHDVKLASSMLGGLHAMGLQIHIDDFGTGYSSLEALHDLPLDALKIDRSFVSRLTHNERSRELVRTIVTMGRNLDLDVIAEGIETVEELQSVRRLGCTHGQGYLFSRPVPADALEPLIHARMLPDAPAPRQS